MSDMLSSEVSETSPQIEITITRTDESIIAGDHTYPLSKGLNDCYFIFVPQEAFNALGRDTILDCFRRAYDSSDPMSSQEMLDGPYRIEYP